MNWLIGILRASRLQKIKNEEIRKQQGQEIMLFQKIQGRQLQWFGHMATMDLEKIPYMAIHTRVHATRNGGRRRMCWIDAVKNDRTKRLKMNKAMKLIQERKS